MQAGDQRFWQHRVDGWAQLSADFLKSMFIPDDGNRAFIYGNGNGFAHSGKQIAKRRHILLPANDNKDRHRPAPDPSPPALEGNRYSLQLNRDIAPDFGLFSGFSFGLAFFFFLSRSLGRRQQEEA